MKTEKNEKKNIFWKHQKEGDSFKGVFKEFVTTQYGLAVKLNNGKEEKIIGLQNVALKRLFSKFASKLKSGKDTIEVIFIEKRKVPKTKRMVSIFEVYLNSKQIINEFAISSKKEIDEFFSELDNE